MDTIVYSLNYQIFKMEIQFSIWLERECVCVLYVKNHVKSQKVKVFSGPFLIVTWRVTQIIEY